MVHTGEKELTDEDYSSFCPIGCCGHHVASDGKVWHRCTLWVGICLCKVKII